MVLIDAPALTDSSLRWIKLFFNTGNANPISSTGNTVRIEVYDVSDVMANSYEYDSIAEISLFYQQLAILTGLPLPIQRT